VTTKPTRKGHGSHVWFSEDTWARIQTIAKQNESSSGAAVRLLVREALNARNGGQVNGTKST